MRKFIELLKSSLERIDYYRDQVLFIFIRKFWPQYIAPNHITWTRVFLGIAFFVLLFFYGIRDKALVLTLFIIGAFSDMLDGSVARCLKKETRFGAFLDPLADRLLLAPIAFFSLYQENKIVLLALIIAEIANALTSVYLDSKNIFVQSNIFGKTKMVLQSIVFIVILIVWPKAIPLFFIYVLWLSAIFTVLSIFLKIATAPKPIPLNKPIDKNLIKRKNGKKNKNF
jgi:CDP-diacylglycerol--glycerol-3-phosphate 3-phosphatidyltransferase